MEITIKTLKLPELIENANKGTLVLPQFQRSFVWAYGDVIDFLESIFKRYFVGTFLFQDCDSNNIPFDYRAIEGVEIPKDLLDPKKLVLDGQQRITTLHYVLYSPPSVRLKNTKYPYRFFLDLTKLSAEDILDDAIFGAREDHGQNYLETSYQYENKIIPFNVLQSQTKWIEWQTGFEAWLINKDQQEFLRYSREEKFLWSKYINNFFLNFTVPVVEIEMIHEGDEKGLAEVCAIFEKMNTTGVKLSVFDLLTARLYKDNIDLRKLWDETVDLYPLIEEFSERETDTYGVFILRIIGLMRGVETKNKSLINLNPQDFENDWIEASKYLERSLERATLLGEDGFGVFKKNWLPYTTMLPVVAAVLYQIERQGLGAEGYSILKKWYWGSVFIERYQSAIESKTTADYKSIMQAILNNDMSGSVFEDINSQILDNANFTLKRTSRVNSLYKGVMNLLALNAAKDFRLEDTIALHELDDHHIFPVKYLKNTYPEIKDERINVVLNKTLLHQSTNRKIGMRKPSDYLNSPEIINQERKIEILRKHFMEDETITYLQNDEYESFLNSRDQYIVSMIKNKLSL